MFFLTDALVIGLRAVVFVALFQAAGAALFLALYERQTAPAAAERLRRFARAAALVALVAAVLHYVLTPARMAGSFGSTFDPSLESLLLRSSSGTAHIVRVVGLAILLLSLDRASRVNTYGACIGAALALWSFALMGHTAIHPQRLILAPLLLVHVVVAAVWLGALAGLYIAARETGTASAPLVARFSAHAGWAVPAIFVCGLGMSVIFIGSFAELATPYGAMVLGKSLAFAALMALAAQNKWRLGPRLSAGDASAVPALRRTVKAEWVLIAVVLAGTAVMTSLYAPEHLEGSFAPEHRDAPAH
ncbi:MAG TPA: CopD family protein [Gammaproteobacteria bacterium]|nr:CopD family protein [Gammaproteobacteria bacterium]